MNMLSYLLLTILINKASAASCIPNDFKEQCLNITFTSGYKSTYYGGFCWVLNTLDLQDWNTATEKCKTDYKEGRLAFMTSRNELDAIKTVFDLGVGAWSGFLRDPAQAIPNGWQYMNSDSALAYAKDPLDEWAPGSPMPVALEDVAAITNDGYIQRNALMILQYLCQFPEPPSCPNKACFDTAVKDSKAATSMGNVTIHVFTDVNIHRCSRLCAELPTCQSFAHNKINKQCELYWLPVEALTLEPAAGFDLLDRNPNYKNCETLNDCFDVCNPAVSSGGSSSYSDQNFPDGSFLDQTQMTLTCDADKRYIQGTTASSVAVSICNAPNWSRNDMNCEKVCQPFSLTAHLAAAYSQSLSDGTVASGETATLSCNGIHDLYVNGVKHSGRNVIVSCTAPNWDITDVECGGHILVFGGNSNNAKLSLESFYPEDPSNNRVEAALNPVRYGASVGLIGNKVMVASGFDGSSYLRSTTMYDPVTKTFTALPDLSYVHHVGEAAVIDDVFYICGGMNPTQSTCEKFNGGTWTQIASMSAPRRRLGVVALNGKIYAIGGFDGSSVLSSVEAYDPSTDTWSTIAPLPVATHRHAAAVLDGHIYICGGQTTVYTDNCYKYSDVTDTWSQVASMNSVRYYGTMVEIGGKLVMLGGGAGATERQSVEVYDPTTDTWSMHPTTLINERYISAAVVVK